MKCDACREENEPKRRVISEGFQELFCPKCEDVYYIVHTIHNQPLIISGEDGKRKQVCPVCYKSLQGR